MDTSIRLVGRRQRARESAPIPYYDAMLAVSRERGLPRHFRTDLTQHDQDALLRLAPGHQHDSVTRIGWILHSFGTNLVLLRESERLDESTARKLAQGADRSACFFLAECGELTEVTREEWVTFMTRNEREAA